MRKKSSNRRSAHSPPPSRFPMRSSSLMGCSDRTVELAAKYVAGRRDLFGARPSDDCARAKRPRQDRRRRLIHLSRCRLYLPEPDRFFTQVLLQFRKYPNLVALTAYLRVFPAEETFGDARTRRCQPRSVAQRQFIQPRRVVRRISDDPTRGVHSFGRISSGPRYH